MQHSGSENLWCGDFPRHVYIHWPFCAQRCTYCEFVALIGQAELMPGYGSMLKSEIKKFKHLVAQRDVRTIFWGGGTPSLCPLDIFSDVMSLFKSHDRDFVEATIETNPEDINSESLAAWKASGINRLSIGVQAFDDAILRRANRRHSADDAVEAVELAAGEFENLSIDLIIGLPGCDEKILRNTIEKAVSLPITHISVYFLMVHSKTPLFYKLQDGTEALPSKIDWNTVYYDVVEFLRQHGFAQYEISNFARPTFESVHNKAYWSREAYKGFGVGAASFDGNTRTVNNKNITGYIDVVRRGELPVDFCEALTFEQEKLERVMLGLRQTRGMSLVDLMALLGDSKTAFIARIDQLKERGVLREDECGRVSLTLEGMPLENEVVAFLCG